jgi:nucleotide-binding universal stress UspA family protein
MPDIARVMAATDFSPPSRHAAQRAAMIAKEANAVLDLVHVFNLDPLAKLRRLVSSISETLQTQMIEDVQAKAARQAEALRQHQGIDAGVHVVTGPLLAGLGAQAQTLGADLVVLGARGESFMRHMLLGSTAARMLSTTRHPMLIVKHAARERYRKLLVPVDFSASSLPALRIAHAVAPAAEIVLLNAFEVPFEGQLRYANVDDLVIQEYRAAARQDALQRMHALRDAAGLAAGSARILLLHGDASRRIIEQEQEIDCDLIVMGRHGESALEHFLIGSVTRHVLEESQSDVLVSV